MLRTFKIHSLLLAVAFGLLAAIPSPAVVASNQASLLKNKRVLVIHGTETSGDHRNARVALSAKINGLLTGLGVQKDSVSGSNPPTSLDAYDIIIFNYWFSNQTSSTAFQNAFKAWVNSTNKKRGWFGMHTSGANELNEWNWLRDSVTSMLYVVHSGSAQAGTIRRTTDAAILNHPIWRGNASNPQALPDTFRVPSDEWYEFSYGPTWPDARVLYYADESTFPTAPQHPMDPHPMAWYRESPVTGNRFFYTPLMHTNAGINSTAGSDFFTSMTLRALEYLAGYDTSGTSINGRAVYNHQAGGIQYLRRSEALKVTAIGAYRLQVLDMGGRQLFRANGKNSGTYRPAALKKPGMYVVRVTGKSGTYAQRVMVQ
jgi:hypothetical protein